MAAFSEKNYVIGKPFIFPDSLVKLKDVPTNHSIFYYTELDGQKVLVKTNKYFDIVTIRSEFEVLLNLTHSHIFKPRIITFYRHHITMENRYNMEIIMDLVQPLNTKIIDSWSPSEKIDVCLQLIDTLIFLEKNGVCHGDIKIMNLLVKNSKPHIFLTDFGLTFNGLLQKSKMIVQSYTDDTKDELKSGFHENYTMMKTSMFSLGITLLIILDSSIDTTFKNFFSNYSNRSFIENPRNVINLQEELKKEEFRLILNLIERLVGEHSKRPSKFSELSSDLEIELNSEPKLIEPNIPEDIFREALIFFYERNASQEHNLVVFEMAAELFIRYYHTIWLPRSGDHRFNNFLMVTFKMAELGIYLDKPLQNSNKNVLQEYDDFMMDYVNIFSFRYNIPVRTHVMNSLSTFCWFYVLKNPQEWNGDLLNIIKDICVEYDIPQDPENIPYHRWLESFAKAINFTEIIKEGIFYDEDREESIVLPIFEFVDENNNQIFLPIISMPE